MSTRKINILCLITCLATAVFVAVPYHAQSQDMLYWAEEGSSSDDVKALWRINLDGTGEEKVLQGQNAASDTILGRVTSLGIDSRLGHVYFGEKYNNYKLRRVNLDGSGFTNLIGATTIIALDLDLTNKKIYYVADSSQIRRSNLDGTGIETLISGLTKVRNLALDLTGGKMYWTVLPGYYDMGFIRRANLDGSGVEEVLATQSPWSFDLDAPEGKMYWGSLGTNWNDYANHNIKRANFDGSNEEIICNLYTSALRLDLRNRKIYFRNGTKISYCNMEVGATVNDLVTGQVNISALALYLPPPAGTILRIY